MFQVNGTNGLKRMEDLNNGESIVSDLFYGKFTSYIVCDECKFVSDRRNEIFTTVSLGVAESDDCDLHVIELHVLLIPNTQNEFFFFSLYSNS